MAGESSTSRDAGMRRRRSGRERRTDETRRESDRGDALTGETVSEAFPAEKLEETRFSALDDYTPDNTLMLTVRYALSALMHVAVVGYVARMMWIGGVFDIARSFYDVKFGGSCGASGHNEYVVLSSRIVAGHDRGGKLVSGGFQVRGGMIGGTYFGAGEVNRTRVLQVLVDGREDVAVYDFGSMVVGPGVIDTHVHMNEPAGARAGWESMAGATSAAAKGGVTMVVDMPLNSDPVTVTSGDVKRKLKLAKKQHVQVGVWGGLVPENARSPGALRGMVRAGAFGFKAFMIDSGIDAFGWVGVDDLRAALPVIRELNVPLLVHAEVQGGAEMSGEGHDVRTYASWLESRPASMELDAVRKVIELLQELEETTSKKKRRPNFRVHVVHASSAETVDLVNRHRDLPITIETCPHYLQFAAEDIPDGATEFKCAPAIRDRKNNDALIAAIRDGRIDGVASDHSPSPASLKTDDFMSSWGGISGIQYTLPALWDSISKASATPATTATSATSDTSDSAGTPAGPHSERSNADLVAVHRVLSGFPAKMLGIHHLKGRLADGYHADFVVWDPEAVYDAPCAQTQDLTPYTSVKMRGRVLATVVRGKFVYDVGAEDGGADVHACGNTAVSRTWLRPHPRG